MTLPADNNIERHYSRPDLGSAILEALAASGKALDRLKPEDLAPVDEFHVRGRQATIELAGKLRLDDSTSVLDVGCGLGGASRFLALEFGCRVTGLDLTADYCRAARWLADRLGLGARVDYRQGSALEIPFADGSFDVVWTQHASMNIADKPRLYAEVLRVLRPGGTFAMYDVLAGPAGPPHFPVPWARQPEISFLIAPGDLAALLERTGLEVVSFRDTSESGLAWFQEVAARASAQNSAPALGYHVLLGPEFRTMAGNMRRNLEEDRVVLIEAVARARKQ